MREELWKGAMRNARAFSPRAKAGRAKTKLMEMKASNGNVEFGILVMRTSFLCAYCATRLKCLCCICFVLHDLS
jgi:hypothetical protein